MGKGLNELNLDDEVLPGVGLSLADLPKQSGTPGEHSSSASQPRPGRVLIDVDKARDSHNTSRTLWKLIAECNEPPRLFIGPAGEPVRLDGIGTTGNPSLKITALTREQLTAEAAAVAQVIGHNMRGNLINQSFPKELIDVMRGLPPSRIPLPRLDLIAHAPMVTPAGEIVTTQGYCPSLRVYFDHDLLIPPVPNQPTADDVRRAVDILNEPLADFPFADASSRATAYAAMITPFAQPLIDPPTPLHLISKPHVGVGATLLGTALMTPALGIDDVEKLAPPPSEVEWTYSLGATLRSCPSVVFIDNVVTLTSPFLAKCLTDTRGVARRVGTSDVDSAPIRCTWLATGVNPEFGTDYRRRIVACRLTADKPEPWLGRTFQISDLPGWLRTHRVDLIWAILTLIRAWIAAGRPKGTPELGRFESYSRVIGGILAVAGVEGFLESPPNPIGPVDFEDAAQHALVCLWANKFSHTPVRAKSLAEIKAIREEDSAVSIYFGKPPTIAQLGRMLPRLVGRTFVLPDGSLVQVVRHPDQDHTAVYSLRPLST
jgi:putative DNA primase/helicase